VKKHVFKNRTFGILGIILLIACSCTREKEPRLPRINEDNIQPVHIARYGQALFSIPPARLKEGLLDIQPEFRFFLDADLDDTLNLIRIREFISDPLLRDIAEDCERQYPDLKGLEDSLSWMFAYYKAWFPEAEIPAVFSYISGLYYEMPVQLVDSVMLIGLDMFLGEDAPWYARVGMPAYAGIRCERHQILPACAARLADRHLIPSVQDDLIGAMLQEGRRLYFMESLLPSLPEQTLAAYTSGQLEWCHTQEENLWGFLVDNELFYSKDAQMVNQMMQDGPFTNAFGKDSPPRLGQWLGWQVVRSFMESHRDVRLDSLMRMDNAHLLFRESGYRPR